jgi:hypothetical protein
LKWNTSYKHLPNINTHAIIRIAHGIVSDGICSVPEKYSAKQIGHNNAAFIRPIIENVNAICPTGGSPIIFLNITCKNEEKSSKKLVVFALIYRVSP